MERETQSEVVMNRSAFASTVALLFCTVTVSSAFGQVKAVAPTTAPAPAAPAKWVAPVKGVATIEVVRGPSKPVGKELVTPLTIKNTSAGAISLLRIDELWYNKKRDLVSSATERVRKPFLPGEVIQVSLKSPLSMDADVSQLTFTHANGKVDFKSVKKFQ
jgi:hypothetical protein